MKQKVNTNLLAALRRCVQSGCDQFYSDRTIGTALVRRGLAAELFPSSSGGHTFTITDAGRERAKLQADCIGLSNNPVDPSLMEDLPS
jgi:hypothetical protein